MTLAILGLGTAVPPATMSQQQALEVAELLCCNTAEQKTWLPAMYGGTGIRHRHVCLGQQVVTDLIEGTTISGSPFLPKAGDQHGPTTHQRMQLYRREAPRLAVKATATALEAAGRLPKDITHLVTVSCTGFAAPGFDLELANELGISADVQRTHVGFMGCHGSLNGMRVANAFAGSDPDACVLMCSVELCSLHYHYGWEPQKIVANALFADGAAAFVGVPGRHHKGKHWELVANGSHVVHEAADAMSWHIGDHGFVMTLSKKIPEVIQQKLRGWMDKWLAKHGLTIPDVKHWAIHPGGPKILDGVVSALGLSQEATWASREVLGENGNMSSATVLFILDRMRQRGATGPCVALGFGPGLNIEAALLQ
ncbi:type III polyketide synthase [Zavarzinella formosa]|uniref:type III polyketide synthase n=1 Tax=Zavarzinella formosa TaxID=360055 RepID=UPI0002F7A9A4|nr:type III polyketide synthase [Zavarzinella formosa]